MKPLAPALLFGFFRACASAAEVPFDEIDVYGLSLLQRRAQLMLPLPFQRRRAATVHHSTHTNLNLSNLGHNNLGGNGPDIGEENIRFLNVTESSGKSVDLLIEALSGYAAKAFGEHNGYVKSDAEVKIGQIYQAPSSEMSLNFSFVDSATGSPVTLDSFSLSILDLDGYSYHDMDQSIAVCGADDIFFDWFTNLESDIDQDGSKKDKPCYNIWVRHFDGDLNVTDPMDLSDAGKAHSFTAAFSDTSSFNVVLDLSPAVGNHSKALLFAGVAVIPPPSSQDCWNVYQCPAYATRFNGSACVDDNQVPCDLGYCAGNPNTNMSSCSTGPHQGTGGSHCWNRFPCPAGTVRVGDGDGCKDTDNVVCDLGYCAGTPSLNVSSCSTGPLRGYGGSSCWDTFPCPTGSVRSGDGGLCKYDHNVSCDLGYCAGDPNSDVASCYTGPQHGSGGSHCWNNFPCPENTVRVGDGSLCKGGEINNSTNSDWYCDLGYCAGTPTLEVASCVTGPAQGSGGEHCWNTFPCPQGTFRRGDGSGCEDTSAEGPGGVERPGPGAGSDSVDASDSGDGNAGKWAGGGKSCDLGYCDGQPIKNVLSCVTGPSHGVAPKGTFCWDVWPCPQGMERFGYGSACREAGMGAHAGEAMYCDLAYCDGVHRNFNMPCCSTGPTGILNESELSGLVF